MKIVVDGKGQCLSPEDWTDSRQFWECLLGEGLSQPHGTESDEGVADPRAETHTGG